jgi:hypothetical protein
MRIARSSSLASMQNTPSILTTWSHSHYT